MSSNPFPPAPSINPAPPDPALLYSSTVLLPDNVTTPATRTATPPPIPPVLFCTTASLTVTVAESVTYNPPPCDTASFRTRTRLVPLTVDDPTTANPPPCCADEHRSTVTRVTTVVPLPTFTRTPPASVPPVPVATQSENTMSSNVTSPAASTETPPANPSFPFTTLPFRMTRVPVRPEPRVKARPEFSQSIVAPFISNVHDPAPVVGDAPAPLWMLHPVYLSPARSPTTPPSGTEFSSVSIWLTVGGATVPMLPRATAHVVVNTRVFPSPKSPGAKVTVPPGTSSTTPNSDPLTVAVFPLTVPPDAEIEPVALANE